MLSDSALERIAQTTRSQPRVRTLGRVLRMSGMILEAHVPEARVGDLVEIERGDGVLVGEIVGFRDEVSLVVPFGDTRGVAAGARVRPAERAAEVPVSDALLGRVIDAFGRPLDHAALVHADAFAPIERPATPVADRVAIRTPFLTGVRVIDALLSCGVGQRVGLFAGAGVGKTVLIRQIAHQSVADVTVIGLIGERGSEVRDLMDLDHRGRTVIVAATSDRSPMERARGALAATAVAEHFRARGLKVLLILDSLTRYAMALREIGLAAGEPPATKGYPPSVFASLPRLLERVAPLSRGGSITAFYTVLVEGDDLSDPVADSARSLLDGHIVLSRNLASRGHFPAIDVLASTSRVARQVVAPELSALADRARGILALEREAHELKSLGAFVPGANPQLDDALRRGAQIAEWSRQRPDEATAQTDAVRELSRILGAPSGGAR